MMNNKASMSGGEFQTRAKQNRLIRAEALRDQLKGDKYLREIQKIDDELTSIDNEIKHAAEVAFVEVDVEESIHRLKVSPLATAIKRGRARADILMKKADINFRRLNKILPDVKEHDISIPATKFTGMDSLSDELLVKISLGQASNEELQEIANVIGIDGSTYEF